MKQLVLALWAVCICTIGQSQLIHNLPPNGGGAVDVEAASCDFNVDEAFIQATLDRNVRRLQQEGVIPSYPTRNSSNAVSFGFPLRKKASLDFNSYYALSFFVDHNNSGGILDYNCDTRTYNGHKGTDFFTWPFPWYLYENELVEVIAAASGIIIGKFDGNKDDNCSCSGNWNAVYIQHSDGSVAWYGHLKKEVLTTKNVGEWVAKGEYLGIVASSGCSTSPHLHFEVYRNTTYTNSNLIDPFDGNCNSLNNTSWWDNQPANRTPTMNALLTHDAVPVISCPAETEQPNLSNVFLPGATLYTAAYYRDQLQGDLTTFRIKQPDGTIWQNWTHTSPITFTSIFWHWNWPLPPTGPFGTWTLEADYQGQTLSHTFSYVESLTANLNLQVELQGRADYSGDYSIEFYNPTDLMNPLFDLVAAGNDAGIVQINDLTPGTYTLKIKRQGFLARVISNIVLEIGQTSLFPTPGNPIYLLGGDANDDNIVSALDFSILAITFNQDSGSTNFDERGDFNGDGFVSALDFSILASNFNTSGAY